jgi:hypothetical protein
MSYNKSLDFLEMIKNISSKPAKPAEKQEVKRTSVKKPKVQETKTKSETTTKTLASTKTSSSVIAVIDTETNWHDEVMSVGIALADAGTFKCLDLRYYILEPEIYVGGMFDSVLYIAKDAAQLKGDRKKVMKDIAKYLKEKGAGSIFAYNARFDYGHMPELSDFDWFDIMRLAAYKQYNKSIPATAECCKTGRLKRGYGVEEILRMLGHGTNYCETHNAVRDAEDELKIMELMGQPLEAYECARL